jgi:hypothetical protein
VRFSERGSLVGDGRVQMLCWDNVLRSERWVEGKGRGERTGYSRDGQGEGRES